VVRTAGSQPEVIDWPNVLFVRRRLKQIEHMLPSREVVEENSAKAAAQWMPPVLEFGHNVERTRGRLD
jgi:hypothetical protein